MDSKIGTQEQGLRVQIGSSKTRQTTDDSFGKIVQTGLAKTGNAVLTGAALAAPFIPGGAVLSAAITGVGAVRSTAAGASNTNVAVAPNANVVLNDAGSAGVYGGGGAVATPLPGGTVATPGTGVDGLAAAGNSSAVLMQETQRMQEMNQSFNLQYLMLQQNMQSENRQFTTLSNIMKTKHDTAKNAINNVR